MVMPNANGSVLAVPHGESNAGTEGIIIAFPLKAVGGGVAHALCPFWVLQAGSGANLVYQP
jgi:hypothetical protein